MEFSNVSSLWKVVAGEKLCKVGGRSRSIWYVDEVVKQSREGFVLLAAVWWRMRKGKKLL
jgi:hypothetical protein